MAFDSLSEKLQNVFKNLRSKGRLTEDDVKAALKEVKMALLEADVNFKVVKQFVKDVQERAIGQDVMNGLNPGQMVIKIVNEEMVKLMGSETTEIKLQPGKALTVIMMEGLQGAGKTTTSGKLAGQLRKQGRSPLLVACDVYRPAAIKQLQVVGKNYNIPVFEMGTEVSPVEISKKALEYAAQQHHDVILIDTAGRLHNKLNLMNELTKIKKVMEKIVPGAPHEILLVLDGSTGQNAFEQAKQFTAATEVNELAITKLDGTAKGGVVIGISDHFKIPVKYIGLGEGMEDLQVFRRKEFVDSLFGD